MSNEATGVWIEHRHFINQEGDSRFVKLEYHSDKTYDWDRERCYQISHGYSYLFAREFEKNYPDEKIGLETLTDER